MNKPRRSDRGLVVEYLEKINRKSIKRYPDIITELVRKRNGVYALYSGEDLYYVGLAKDLRSRLNGHLKDRHANEWDRFSVFLTQTDEHIKELESLVLRIASPKGNRVTGKFSGAMDLRSGFRQRIVRLQKQELRDMTDREAKHVSKDYHARWDKGEYDTIICPAHPAGFEREFMGKNRWYAIRISKSVQARLKYIAIYITSPVHQITHYGKIRDIRPWKDTGKFAVYLNGRPKRIGPIEFSPKISMQSTRLALMERLLRARTIEEAF